MWNILQLFLLWGFDTSGTTWASYMCTMKQKTWTGSSTDRTQYLWSRLLKAGASRWSLVSLGLRSWGITWMFHSPGGLTVVPVLGCSQSSSDASINWRKEGTSSPKEQSAQRGSLTGRRPSACSSWPWCPVIAGTVSQSLAYLPCSFPCSDTAEKITSKLCWECSVWESGNVKERISGKLTWVSNSSANCKSCGKSQRRKGEQHDSAKVDRP